MGGVDLADQLIALYRISFCVRKYYHKLVFHLLDMSVANACFFIGEMLKNCYFQ